MRDQQVIDVDAQLLGIGGIEGVLGVDEGGHASGFLGLGDYLQRDGGFAGRLGAEDFDHASAGKAAYA